MGRLAQPIGQRPQRRVFKEGNIAYATTATRVNIGQQDYLSGLDIISLNTVTTLTTAPSGTSGAGAYAPIQNVQVQVNGGQTPFNMPGYHANEYYKLHRHDYTDSLATNPVVTSTTNTWVNNLRIPLTVDPNTELGSWFTGDVTMQMSAVITGNAVGTVFQTTQSATIGGSWDVFAEKFSAPSPDEPNGWLKEISFYKQSYMYLDSQALSNGTTNINLPVDVDYVRVMLVFHTGNSVTADHTFAPADSLYSNLTLLVNGQFRPFDTVTEAAMRQNYLETYRLKNTAGTTAIDFMRLEPAGRRDILPTDAQAVNSLQLQITSTSSSNNVDVVVDYVTTSSFAAKWARLAQAKAGAGKGG